MTKVLALTLCLMLLPVMASAYTFGKSGVIKEIIFGIPIFSSGAMVTLKDETNGAPNPFVITGIDGKYLVTKTTAFPATKLFIKQCWHVHVEAGLTSDTAKGSTSCWTFNRANPCETKICVENFEMVYKFDNCKQGDCPDDAPMAP